MLVVERDATASQAIAKLAEHGADALITSVESAERALETLDGLPCACVITGHGISKAAAFRLVETLGERAELRGATFIMFPERELTARDSARLRRLSGEDPRQGGR